MITTVQLHPRSVKWAKIGRKLFAGRDGYVVLNSSIAPKQSIGRVASKPDKDGTVKIQIDSYPAYIPLRPRTGGPLRGLRADMIILDDFSFKDST